MSARTGWPGRPRVSGKCSSEDSSGLDFSPIKRSAEVPSANSVRQRFQQGNGRRRRTTGSRIILPRVSLHPGSGIAGTPAIRRHVRTNQCARSVQPPGNCIRASPACGGRGRVYAPLHAGERTRIRHGSDLVRRHPRRRDGALRDGGDHRRRRRAARFRQRRGADHHGGEDWTLRGASAGSWAWVRSGWPRSTDVRKSPSPSRARRSPATTPAPCRGWASATPPPRARFGSRSLCSGAMISIVERVCDRP